MLMRIIQALRTPGGFHAAITWPVFSLSSFQLVTRLLAHGISPRTVLDVGANVGQFSVTASKLFPECHIFAFEPLPEATKQLRANLSRARWASVFELALSDSAGTASFHVNTHSHSSSLLRLGAAHRHAFPSAQESKIVEIKTSTLDLVFADEQMTGPVLLKIDVQGAEARVLKGASKTLAKIDHVLVETSLSPLYEDETAFPDLLDLMSARGFRFVRPIGWLLHPKSSDILQMDVLFENTRRSSTSTVG